MGNPLVSVVLPAYNGASRVTDSVRRLLAFYAEAGIQGEVIVVDDGSTDSTFEAVPRLEGVRVIRFEKNRGKGAAVRAGMLEAKGRVCVFTDVDLPYGTQPISQALYYILEKGFHAVVGDRTLPGSIYNHPGWARKGFSVIGSLMIRTLVTGGIYDTQCGFKGFDKDVAREVFSLTRIDGFAMDVEVFYLLLKYRLEVKRIRVHLGSHGPSSVRVIRDSIRAMVDIFRLYRNWRRGRYKTAKLEAILAHDLDRAEECAKGAIGKTPTERTAEHSAEECLHE